MSDNICESCGANLSMGERHRITMDRPEIEQLEEWESEGGCEATDGCWVEPDGKCPHGHRSWMLVMGMI